MEYELRCFFNKLGECSYAFFFGICLGLGLCRRGFRFFFLGWGVDM